jgi:hypothetical protein
MSIQTTTGRRQAITVTAHLFQVIDKGVSRYTSDKVVVGGGDRPTRTAWQTPETQIFRYARFRIFGGVANALGSVTAME